MTKTCCCTGHRPAGFPFEYGADLQKHNAYLRALCEKTEQIITEQNATRFISGMALGVDLDFAECVLFLRDSKYPQISLECALPCPEQTKYWGGADIKRYNKILSRADEVKYISDCYTNFCMHKRNRYMVDKSQIVIAVFNGIERGGTWYTMNYAKSKGKRVEVIHLKA